jgi:hypothetical protein
VREWKLSFWDFEYNKEQNPAICSIFFFLRKKAKGFSLLSGLRNEFLEEILDLQRRLENKEEENRAS